MWGSGFRWGRRRRRASAGVVLLILLPMVGYDYIRGELQKREEWTGTIVRVYVDRSFFGGRHRSYSQYWDVRTADGEVRSVRVRPTSVHSAGHVGDYVVKQAGQYDPMIAVRR